MPAVTFPEIVDASFGPIRQYARSSAVVTIRLLETIAVIAGATHRPADRAALLRQAEMIVRGARQALPEDGDRREVEERYRDVSRALRGSELSHDPTSGTPASRSRRTGASAAHPAATVYSIEQTDRHRAVDGDVINRITDWRRR